jgi:hypothetical protein
MVECGCAGQHASTLIRHEYIPTSTWKSAPRGIVYFSTAMDPVSILGLVSSLITIADVIKSSLTRLRSLQSNYQNSSLAVSLLIGQLNTLKAALDQITEWVSSSFFNIPKHQQLISDINTSVESCKVLLSFLGQRIGQLTWNDEDTLDVKGRIVFMWEKLGLDEFTNHLNNQTNALNLLLTALSW